MRNYDTTNGLPFVYSSIQQAGKDPATGDYVIEYTTRMALIKDANGITRFLDGPVNTYAVRKTAEQLGETVPRIDLATNAKLPGPGRTYADIFAGGIDAVRAHQEEIDAQVDAQATAQNGGSGE